MIAERMLILGTGALANLFAARLARAVVAVTMLGTWPEGIAALQAHGVELVSPDGRAQTFPVRATADPTECAGAKRALVLVKSWQTARAARQLAACLSPDGLVLTLQNGLGNRELLVERLGAARVLSGSTTTGATLLGPGRVRPGGEGVVTLERHPGLARFQPLFAAAGFRVEITDDMDALLWGKLTINAAINPLTAVLRLPNGELLTRPGTRSLMAALANETAAVAATLGIQLPFDDPVVAAEEVARRTAANHSSMLQDVERGAPTEIDAICGAVTRFGEQVGVPTPVNRTLWQLVQALSDHRGQPSVHQPTNQRTN